MVEIEVTAAEKEKGQLTPENHALAVKALREDGIVVLGGIVSQTSIDVLRERALEDVKALVNRKDAPFNWTKGNVQQDPAPFPPYLFRDVLVNDIVISVTKAILGNGMHCAFYSGNTAMPSKERQPVHADEGQLWADLEVVTPAYALVVNVPLVDMGPENGSTEMWLGTHLDPTVAIQNGDITLNEAQVEAQRAIKPPLQPVVKAGGVVIRDMRMWHAGMPNHTENPRPVIAMIHTIGWKPAGSIKFAEGSQEFLSHPDLRWDAEYTSEPIDHIASPYGFMAPAN